MSYYKDKMASELKTTKANTDQTIKNIKIENDKYHIEAMKVAKILTQKLDEDFTEDRKHFKENRKILDEAIKKFQDIENKHKDIIHKIRVL